MTCSIDTIEHNRLYYLPRNRGLEGYTTTKGGSVRLDSLTTRELMGIRRFWDPATDIEWTIPGWASHLNHAICKS